jgi:hypothetical protein
MGDVMRLENNKVDWENIKGIKRKGVGGRGVMICVGSRKSG